VPSWRPYGLDGNVPTRLVALGDTVYFSASDAEHGFELWRSDGTVEGTRPVVDLFPGGFDGEPLFLTAFGGRVWFSARTPQHGRELWSSDGTEAGTRLEVELLPGAESYESLFLVSLGDRLVVALYGYGIWVSDGTPAGTRQIDGRSADSAEVLAVFQGRLYYVSQGVLWVTDGTEAGTGPLPDREGRLVISVFRFAALGDRLLFIAVDQTGHLVLWQTDGTPAGTFPLHPPDGMADVDLVRAGDRVFFSGYGLTTGSELWAVRP
jgi:ELWxxDGT repeat protein